MSELTPGQAVAVVSALVLLLLKREGTRIFNAVDRIPSPEWFERVEKHMRTGHEHSNVLQTHAYMHQAAKDALEKGRIRMNEIDKHIAHTDEQVADHETRLSVIEAARS